MGSLLIKAEDLSVGDTLLLPMGREATVLAMKPVKPRTRFVQFKTEEGWTRVERAYELFIEAKVIT